MKTEICLIFIILVTMIFEGCETRPILNSPPDGPAPSVLIIRFKGPAYMKHLIVTSDHDQTGSLLMRGNQCERTQYLTFGEYDADGSKMTGDWNFSFPERLRDPFWSLPDGWYLIDWAWFGLETPYPFNGNTILTDITLENYREYGASSFDKSVPHIYFDSQNKIFESRKIKVADLMGYSYPDENYPSYTLREYDKKNGIDTIVTYPNQYFYFKQICHTRAVSNVTNCCCEIADELDAFWTLLQSQIANVINNDDLDNMPVFDINILYTNSEL